MRSRTRTALLCLAVSFTACVPDGGDAPAVETGGDVAAESTADAVEAVPGAAGGTWVVAATQPYSCAATADGFGFELEACSDASESTPVVFAEFSFPEQTCTRAEDVTFALSPPARSNAPDRFITIDATRSADCEEPLKQLVAAGRINLTEASDGIATRILAARLAVDQNLHGPPVLLLYDAAADLLVPWEPPSYSHDGSPIEE